MSSELSARSRAIPKVRPRRMSWTPKSVLFGFCLVLLLLGMEAAADAQEPPRPVPGQVFRTPFEFEKLHNGLQVILVPFDSPGVVAYWTIVLAGSRNEVEPGRSGYAHLFEHLMFRGTTSYPQERYNQTMALMGADHNAFTDRDWTVYTSTLPSSELPRMIEIQADRFQNLSYDEQAHIQECGAVLGEFNIGKADPGTVLYEKLFETAYTTHTYRHTDMGWEEDVRSMPEGYDYGRLFFKRHYRPDNCAIVVAGDFEKGRVLSQILKHYQLWKPGAEVANPDPEPQQTGARRAEITWPGPTTPRIVMGFHVPAYNPDNMDAAAMDVLNELAFGPTSPFYRRWVEESMRAQSVESEVPRTVDPGLFTIEVVLNDPADLGDVRQDILTTFQGLVTDPPTVDLLERLKQHLINEFKSRLETPESLAYTLGQMYVLTREYRTMQWYFIRLRRVAPEDIQRLATEHLIESNSTTVTLVSAEGS